MGANSLFGSRFNDGEKTEFLAYRPVVGKVQNKTMRPSLSIRLAMLLAGIHLALSLGSFWISFSTGMKRFDAGAPLAMGTVEATASFLSSLLLQPMLGVWSVVFTGHSSVLLQWAAILLNSLLWGAALAFVIGILKPRRVER